MNSKTAIKYPWMTIAVKNLSNHLEEKFKIAKFLRPERNVILFDIHEFNKGRKTDKGFTVMFPEFIWIKNVLKANDSMKHTLEHNNRIITINNFTITVQKADGSTKEIVLSCSEVSTLLQFIQDNEDMIKTTFNVSVDFPESSFYRMT